MQQLIKNITTNQEVLNNNNPRHNNTIKATSILGIPIDNVNMTEAVDRIFEFVKEYSEDMRSRYVATVNVDFVVNTLAWGNDHVSNTELLHILRKADLAIADGMPLVWLSKLIGTPLKERVTGADLVPKIAEKASTNGKSIYFLGGRPGIAKQAADKLQQSNKGLKIAGTLSPNIYNEGLELLDAEEEDSRIIADINNCNPDILLIGLGNPKQEIWFERNKHRLKVPVSIGVGGTYEFIVGTVKRAPKWMQKSGLEWVYRITKDPKRLWKRYFVGLFKFSIHALPLISNKKNTYTTLKTEKTQKNEINTLHIKSKKTKFILLPSDLTSNNTRDLYYKYNETSLETKIIVFDLSNINQIDGTGLSTLIRTCNHIDIHKQRVQFIGITPEINRILQKHRLFDFVRNKSSNNLITAISTVQKKAQKPDYIINSDINDIAYLKFFGNLNVDIINRINQDILLSALGNRNCVVDLNETDTIDSASVLFLLKIKKHITSARRNCIIKGINANSKKTFCYMNATKLLETQDS